MKKVGVKQWHSTNLAQPGDHLDFCDRRPKPRTVRPDYTGTLKLQRRTMEVLSQQFQETNANEIECCLASWRNIDASGQAYASVELSPKYIARPRQEPNDANSLADFI